MSLIAEIKQAIDTTAYIRASVELTRSGRNLKGRCPFHAERTPSFYVFPDKGTWRCFGGCADGGDLIAFVQKRDRIDTREAVRKLAQEAGIEVRKQNPILTEAIRYYRSLPMPPFRSLTLETITTFQLGVAPDDWRILHDRLRTMGYDGDLPRFNNRIMFPIWDEYGSPVGFAGRGEDPKYLNTPGLEKARLLYAMHLAAPAIRDSKAAIVVEGYMDVITPWQHGYRNIVACMGTALTPQQAHMLKRYTSRIILALDPDKAGQSATERIASVLALDPSLDIRIAILTADPDDMVKNNPAEWESAIANARPVAEYLIDMALGSTRPSAPAEASVLAEKVIPLLSAISDPITRAIYIQRTATFLRISERALAERLKPRAKPAPAARAISQGGREQALVNLCLAHPELLPIMANVPPSMFEETEHRTAFERWQQGKAEPITSPPTQEAPRLATILVKEILMAQLQEMMNAVADEISNLSVDNVTDSG